MPLAGAEVPKLLQVRTASPLLCRPPVLLARPWPARTLFLSSLCHLLPSCHAGFWLTPPVHRGANARIHQSGDLDATLFLPRAFSAEMEMQLTRSQVATMPTTSTTFGASERASLVAGWIKKRAQATRPSSRLLPARDEVIYIFRTASAQAHRMPQTSSIWDKTHGCTMVSVSQALRRRSVEIRTAARPSSFPSLPAVSKTADPSFRKPFRPSRLYSHPLPPSHRSLQAGHMQGWLLHL